MNKLFFISAFIIPFSLTAQKTNYTKEQLTKKITEVDKSYNRKSDKKYNAYVVDKYLCFQKNYEINPMEHYEFWTKAQHIKEKKQILKTEPDTYLWDKTKSILRYTSTDLGQKDVYSKCAKDDYKTEYYQY